MKGALLLWARPSVGRRRTKRTQCLDGRVLRRRRGFAPWRPPDHGSLVTAPGGERCSYADVFVTLHHGWEANSPDLRRFAVSPDPLQRCAGPTSAVCKALLGLMHLSQSSAAPSSVSMTTGPQGRSQILCMEQNCCGNSIGALIHSLLTNVMWGKAVMVVQDSGLIHFSTLNTSSRSTSS